MRKLAAVLSLGLTGSVLTLLACGGDGAQPASTPPDASTTSAQPTTTTTTTPPPPPAPDADIADAAPVGPQAVAGPVTVYVGESAKVDGSPSTGPAALSFAWTVKTVPAGSAIATASLAGASTATPSFVPDKPGAYVLELTVTSNGVPSTTQATVTAVDPPLFLLKTENDASVGYEARIEVLGATAGTTSTPVACFRTDAGSYDTIVRHTAQGGTDWWEAPAAEASPLAFILDTKVDGGAAAMLGVTTSASTCATAAKTVDVVPGSADGNVHALEQPRISPDGKRIAYVRFTGTEGARVATVGLDGSNPRVLGARFALSDGGASDAGINGYPSPRPVWVDADTVAWVRQLDSTNWQVVRADDVANATTQVAVTCTGNAPLQIDFLPNGDLIAVRSASNVTELVAFPVDANTKACGAARSISQNGANTSLTDMSLSPDKTHVAYTFVDSANGTNELRVANVDGMSPPVAVAAPVQGNTRGPRWVGRGAYLTWGTFASSFDAGAGNAAVVVPADGGVARMVATQPAGGTLQPIGNGVLTSCSIGHAAGSGATAFGVAGVLALRLVRRRRRAS